MKVVLEWKVVRFGVFMKRWDEVTREFITLDL